MMIEPSFEGQNSQIFYFSKISIKPMARIFVAVLIKFGNLLELLSLFFQELETTVDILMDRTFLKSDFQTLEEKYHQ